MISGTDPLALGADPIAQLNLLVLSFFEGLQLRISRIFTETV